MRVLSFVFILTSLLYSKECYFTKHDKVCFYPYFKVDKLKNPKFDEKYYRYKDGYVYVINDKLKVTLDYVGGILYILDNFEVEFFDKKNYNTFVLKVKNKNEIFSTATNLNRLNAVRKAEPLIQRKDYKPFGK